MVTKEDVIPIIIVTVLLTITVISAGFHLNLLKNVRKNKLFKSI